MNKSNLLQRIEDAVNNGATWPSADENLLPDILAYVERESEKTEQATRTLATLAATVRANMTSISRFANSVPVCLLNHWSEQYLQLSNQAISNILNAVNNNPELTKIEQQYLAQKSNSVLEE